MPDKVLKILRRVSEIIAENERIDAMLAEIVRLLADNLQVSVCSIYAWDNRTGTLVLRAAHGLNPACVGQFRVKPEEGITGWCFQQQQIINIADAQSHPRFRTTPEIGEDPYRSFLAVPLISGGRCAGILNLQSPRPRRFRPGAVDMVRSLSSQLANLLFNATLLAELATEEDPSPVAAAAGQVMLRGVAANPGLAIGRATLLDNIDRFTEIHPAYHTDVARELLLLENALRQARQETMDLERQATALISEADSSIFNVHLLFLEDQTILDAIRRRIFEDRCAVEYAIKLVNDDFQARFARLGSEIFREKSMDLKDVLLRLLKAARQRRDIAEAPAAALPAVQQQIIVTRELLPSDLFRLPPDRIAGIICEKGGATAHVAVLAKALKIPAIMGVSGVIAETHEGDEVILDGAAEVVYLRPQPEVQRQFQELWRVRRQLDASPDPAPARLRGGGEIAVRANLSLVGETALLAIHGARGIGLYRSEFLFMVRDNLPDEDLQFRVFSKIVKGAGGEQITIRTLDVGSDKPLPYLPHPREDNPALGWRGIRFLLDRSDILKSQLKAILRAGASAPIRILFPMVANRDEVLQLRQAINDAETELHAKSIDHAASYQVGIMIEVPAAVFGLETLLKYVDFISIGSNDLFQYTFAIDRGNDKVAAAFQFFHPVFLNIISRIVNTVSAVPNKEVAICGEMAGNPMAVPLLIGAGIADLSMAPLQIPQVKRVIRAFSRQECRQLFATALHTETPEAVADLIRHAFAEKQLDLAHQVLA